MVKFYLIVEDNNIKDRTGTIFSYNDETRQTTIISSNSDIGFTKQWLRDPTQQWIETKGIIEVHNELLEILYG